MRAPVRVTTRSGGRPTTASSTTSSAPGRLATRAPRSSSWGLSQCRKLLGQIDQALPVLLGAGTLGQGVLRHPVPVRRREDLVAQHQQPGQDLLHPDRIGGGGGGDRRHRRGRGRGGGRPGGLSPLPSPPQAPPRAARIAATARARRGCRCIPTMYQTHRRRRGQGTGRRAGHDGQAPEGEGDSGQGQGVVAGPGEGQADGRRADRWRRERRVGHRPGEDAGLFLFRSFDVLIDRRGLGRDRREHRRLGSGRRRRRLRGRRHRFGRRRIRRHLFRRRAAGRGDLRG